MSERKQAPETDVYKRQVQGHLHLDPVFPAQKVPQRHPGQTGPLGGDQNLGRVQGEDAGIVRPRLPAMAQHPQVPQALDACLLYTSQPARRPIWQAGRFRESAGSPSR